MKPKIKLLSCIVALAVFASVFSGCAAIYKIAAPKEYKSVTDGADEYPEDSIPIYNNVTIYKYDQDNKGNITIKFGSEEPLEEVAEFYSDYFEDNDIWLTNEKDRSSTYIADGEHGYYRFELTLEVPTQKWEKRLYSSIAEIEIEKVNIPNKSKLLKYIEQVEADIEDFEDIFKKNAHMDESDEDSPSYYIDIIDEILTTLSDIETQLSKRDVPDLSDFNALHGTEIEIVKILNNNFEEYKDILLFFEEYNNISADFDEFMDTYNDYWYDEYKDIVYIFGSLSQNLKDLEAPSSLHDYVQSFTTTLDNAVDTARYGIDAIEYEDAIRFHASKYSYNMIFRELDNDYDSLNADINFIAERLESEIDYMTETKDGLKDWLALSVNDIENDSENIIELSDEFKLADKKKEILCDYIYPDEIIPANYRSMDYIAFIQISASKGHANAMLTVEIPGFTQKFEQKIEISRTEAEYKIHPPLLEDAIESLNTNKDAQIKITVEDLDTGELYVRDTVDINLLSRYDMQWYDENDNSYIENILAWMTPEAPEISDLIRAAADSASYLTDGELSNILGYQYVSDWSEAYITYIQSASLMHALATELNVTYIAEPFSSSGTNLQRVKTPPQTIKNEGGLCIETALTIASALQAMGMHPVLVFPPGHVQVAVETWYGSGEYLLIETTALESAANEDFSNVIVFPDTDEWDEYLSQSEYVTIDCELADSYGIKSID